MMAKFLKYTACTFPPKFIGHIVLRPLIGHDSSTQKSPLESNTQEDGYPWCHLTS